MGCEQTLNSTYSIVNSLSNTVSNLSTKIDNTNSKVESIYNILTNLTILDDISNKLNYLLNNQGENTADIVTIKNAIMNFQSPYLNSEDLSEIKEALETFGESIITLQQQITTLGDKQVESFNLSTSIANTQGENTVDIVSIKETVNNLTPSIETILNSQGENTVDIVKVRNYIQVINTMLGLSN